MLIGIKGDVADDERPRLAVWRRTGLVHRRPPQQRTQAGDELTDAIRLGDVVVGTDFETDDHVDLRALGRHHDNRDGADLAQFATDVDAGDARQHQVEQHDVGLDVVEALQRRGPIRGDLHAKPFAVEPDSEGFDEAVFILHEQHGWGGHAASTGRSGMWSRNVEPSPSRDSTVTAPPWLAATCRTMDRPSPVPPVPRPRARSTR